ncbi:MAG: DUF3179 domain-containing protein [Rhizobiales bacterium]|nr:DUF3179 domain-containing protein [Hyphomicrobiales bacterium]
MRKRLSHFLSAAVSIGAVAFLSFALAPIATKPSFAQASNGTAAGVANDRVTGASVEDLSLLSLIGERDERLRALDALVARGNKDIIPTLVLFMNIGGDFKPMAEALQKLTGAEIHTWRDAALWQEAHPEVVPHESYRTLKLRYFGSIDQKFLDFFDPKTTSRDQMKIRLEEITWGGVLVDGIPSLDNPKLIKANDADYLLPNDLVFGVEINGDVRAYPLRIMGWHEMFNETIGGVPVALAYCTLCGAGILFETNVEGRKKPFVFGSSGFLYRSNKLMFDRETKSLWNQFTGEPVVGKLADSGIRLKIRPVTITSWEAWRKEHPGTRVLALDTGYIRDYGSGVVYRDYFSSPDLMFPTVVRDESVLKRKDYVFGIREFGAAKAWPVDVFKGSKTVINDRVGGTDIVLIGDAETRTVRAYQRDGLSFTKGGKEGELKADGTVWQVTEDGLIAPDGRALGRVAGHVAYWFAWDGYLGVKSELYPG